MEQVADSAHFIPCSTRMRPDTQGLANSRREIAVARLPTAEKLAVVVDEYWGINGVNLTVSFMEQVSALLKDKILSYMNAWSNHCNVKFTLTAGVGDVRISLKTGGYWSYVGRSIHQIPTDQQTMNLEGFTLNTPDEEYRRVVIHETGHTLGFPHEHMRKKEVARLDPAKTYAYFMRQYGWNHQDVQQQVLTPLDEASIRGTPEGGDDNSIMCYQLPGSITKDGMPIAGGVDLDALDKQFAGTLYPLPVSPPVQKKTVVLTGFGTDDGVYIKA